MIFQDWRDAVRCDWVRCLSDPSYRGQDLLELCDKDGAWCRARSTLHRKCRAIFGQVGHLGVVGFQFDFVGDLHKELCLVS